MKRISIIMLLLVMFCWSCTKPEVTPTVTTPPAPAETTAPVPSAPPPATIKLPAEVSPFKIPSVENGENITPERRSQLPLGATSASDDDLFFWATNLPPGAVLDNGPGPNEAVFNWTPTHDQVGIWWNVTIYVTDGELQDSETIYIEVRSTNKPPVLQPIPVKVVEKGNLVTFTLQTSDPDGDELTFSAHNLPPGAQFSPPSFSWVPAEAGIWPAIFFTVSDGKLKATQEVIIAVLP